MAKVWSVICLVCAAALAQPARAAEVLTADNVLIVEFEINPPFLCGTVPCNPDVLQMRVGPVFIPQSFGERTARLFVDDVFLGTWLNTDFGLFTGNLGNFNTGLWKDAASPYTVLDPAVIDFAPVLAGTMNARIEFRILRGQVEMEDGFPNAQIFMIEASGPGSGGIVLDSTPITSIRIEASPATFVVDSTASDPDTVPGDGLCATAAGDCTLPAAVEETNALLGTHRITVPAGSYPGGFTISDNLSISGAGPGATTVDGGGAAATITIGAGDVNLSGLAITGGNNAGSGGGIDAHGGELFLLDVEIFGNNAAGHGGGISYTAGDLLDLLDTVVRDNTASGSGGGIHFTAPFADLQLLLTELLDNDAVSGDGGGLHVDGNTFVIADALTVRGNTAVRGGGIATRSLFSLIAESHVFENQAAQWAGGIAARGGDVVIEDSTLSNNSSTASGVGGLFAFDGVILEVFNSTFSNNQGQLAGGVGLESPFDADLGNNTLTLNTGSEAGGLGLAANTGIGDARLANSIVAGNVSTGLGRDCRSTGAGVTLVSQGYNLIGDGSDCAFPAVTGDQVGSASAPIDPLLAPLGLPPFLAGSGLPPVHGLLPGSPAIDAGNPAVPESVPEACVAVDAIGTVRPLDGDLDGSAVCDIGAVELGVSAVPALAPGAVAALAIGLAGCAAARNRKGAVDLRGARSPE